MADFGSLRLSEERRLIPRFPRIVVYKRTSLHLSTEGVNPRSYAIYWCWRGWRGGGGVALSRLSSLSAGGMILHRCWAVGVAQHPGAVPETGSSSRHLRAVGRRTCGDR